MAKIKTLKQGNEQIIPRTLAEAVSTSNDSTVQIELDNLTRKVEEVPDVSAQINAHNTNPEAHSDKFGQYLPLSGGTMTGDINLLNENMSISAKDTDTYRGIAFGLNINSDSASGISVGQQLRSGNTEIELVASDIILMAEDFTLLYVDETKISDQSAVTKGYVDDQIKAIPTPDVSAQISAHNTAEDAHANKHWLTSSNEELSEVLPGEPIDADTLQGRPASYFVDSDALNLQLQNYALKTEVQTLTEQLSALTTRVTNIENEINGVAAKIDEINGEVI